MNRAKRVPLSKQFTPGGVYNPAKPVVPINTANLMAPAPEQVPPADQTPVVQPPPAPVPFFQLKEEQSDLPKDSEQTDNNNGSMDNGDDEIENLGSGKPGKGIFKKIFLKRKKSSVRQKEKRMRQNKQLRKSITPKNALMALNEVKGIAISDFIITNAANNGFMALVTVNNKQYEGRGTSKVAAKNDACEKALRDYVLEKMRSHPRFTKANNGQGNMETDTDNGNGCDSADDGNHNDNNMDDHDDVPMLNLASFALFKLFSSWENEGYEIPEMHPSHQNMSSNISNAGSDTGSVRKEPNKPAIRNELPPDWENIHPATLLCMMRPGLTYVDDEAVGDNPNTLQSVYIMVDEQKFVGAGRSKKVARRHAAINACNQLFGTNFTETE